MPHTEGCRWTTEYRDAPCDRFVMNDTNLVSKPWNIFQQASKEAHGPTLIQFARRGHNRKHHPDRSEYPGPNLLKAMAAIRSYGLRAFTDLRATRPGIWLVTAAVPGPERKF